ncbi:uncharacterized protein [Antedon mediterranea]|uniref:uncharacterized protein isoform X1 n=1 Tax=Antedon mediterranea TaxID=105859 RepID=UPI003AF68B2C
MLKTLELKGPIVDLKLDNQSGRRLSSGQLVVCGWVKRKDATENVSMMQRLRVKYQHDEVDIENQPCRYEPFILKTDNEQDWNVEYFKVDNAEDNMRIQLNETDHGNVHAVISSLTSSKILYEGVSRDNCTMFEEKEKSSIHMPVVSFCLSSDGLFVGAPSINEPNSKHITEDNDTKLVKGMLRNPIQRLLPDKINKKGDQKIEIERIRKPKYSSNGYEIVSTIEEPEDNRGRLGKRQGEGKIGRGKIGEERQGDGKIGRGKIEERQEKGKIGRGKIEERQEKGKIERGKIGEETQGKGEDRSEKGGGRREEDNKGGERGGRQEDNKGSEDDRSERGGRQKDNKGGEDNRSERGERQEDNKGGEDDRSERGGRQEDNKGGEDDRSEREGRQEDNKGGEDDRSERGGRQENKGGEDDRSERGGRQEDNKGGEDDRSERGGRQEDNKGGEDDRSERGGRQGDGEIEGGIEEIQEENKQSEKIEGLLHYVEDTADINAICLKPVHASSGKVYTSINILKNRNKVKCEQIVPFINNGKAYCMMIYSTDFLEGEESGYSIRYHIFPEDLLKEL